MAKSKVANVYIDGFNLYWGMVSRGWEKYKWLDLQGFAKTLLPSNHKLGQLRYFTTRVKGDHQKYLRQDSYISALRVYTNNNIDIKFGRYQLFPSHCKHCKTKPVYCSNCSAEYSKSTEKKTDVNIATSMMVDCITQSTNCIILVSGDSDYEAPLIEMNNLFPKILRHIAFPPMRRNPSLYNLCDYYFDITEDSFMNNQLPNPVISIKGKNFHKPVEWP